MSPATLPVRAAAASQVAPYEAPRDIKYVGLEQFNPYNVSTQTSKQNSNKNKDHSPLSPTASEAAAVHQSKKLKAAETRASSLISHVG